MSISETLPIQVGNLYNGRAHSPPGCSWLLMAHFQQTVTWVGLELDGAGVIREGGVSKGGGVTRSGWKMDTFTITSTVWA